MAGVKGTFFGGRCPGKVLICAQEVLNSPLLLPAKSETCGLVRDSEPSVSVDFHIDAGLKQVILFSLRLL